MQWFFGNGKDKDLPVTGSYRQSPPMKVAIVQGGPDDPSRLALDYDVESSYIQLRR